MRHKQARRGATGEWTEQKRVDRIRNASYIKDQSYVQAQATQTPWVAFFIGGVFGIIVVRGGIHLTGDIYSSFNGKRKTENQLCA